MLSNEQDALNSSGSCQKLMMSMTNLSQVPEGQAKSGITLGTFKVSVPIVLTQLYV